MRAGSLSLYHHGTRPKKIIRGLNKVLAKDTITDTDQATISIPTAGKQAIAQVGVHYHQTHIAAMMAQAITQNGSVAPGSTQNTTHIILNDLEYVCKLANSSNSAVQVEIYDCIARRDLYKDAAGQNVTTAEAVALGLQDQSNGTTAVTTPGTTPFDSDLFCKMWKVKKVTHMMLSVGEVHCHRVHWSPNRVMDNEIVRQQNVYGFRGLTTAVLVRVSGMPMENDVSSSVTLAPVKLLYAGHWSYRFTWVANNQAYTLATNNYSANPNANIMDQIQGTAQAFQLV